MKKITRTITTIEAIVKAYNKENKSIDTITVVIGDVDEAKVEKAVAKALPSGLVLVEVEATKSVEQLYSMSVETFIANAEKVD